MSEAGVYVQKDPVLNLSEVLSQEFSSPPSQCNPPMHTERKTLLTSDYQVAMAFSLIKHLNCGMPCIFRNLAQSQAIS